MFVCPACGYEKLELAQTDNTERRSEITEGSICCSSCGVRFPISRGIPRFVDTENYSRSFEYQWNLHKKSQLDSYTGLPISRNRLFTVTGWRPDDLQGKTVLEAGSGAGRFTEVLLDEGADVVSFDYSSAVDVNFENQNRSSNFVLFQGDILKVPLRRRAYSKVLCLGVLQHTSSPEEAFKNLAALVAPGGEIVVDVYKKSLSSWLQWKYTLRPITKRINKESLYKFVTALVTVLLPLVIVLRKVAGRVGVRLMPIPDYSHLGLTYKLNKEWSILDTFDMYSPKYDYPQSRATVSRWLREAGLEDITVTYGQNGIVARGKYPSETNTSLARSDKLSHAVSRGVSGISFGVSQSKEELHGTCSPEIPNR